MSIEYESDLILDLRLVWHAHSAQRLIIDALFSGKKLIFLDSGRKFGKSDVANAIANIWAASYQDSPIYVVAPTLKQCRELHWANNRLPQFWKPDEKLVALNYGLDPENKPEILNKQAAIWQELKGKYISQVLKNESRVTYVNGSFVKLDGSDNADSDRGTNPGLQIIEELKDHSPTYFAAMRPNLGATNAPLVVIGTPPRGDESGADLYNELKMEAISADYGAYFNFPSWVNPHVDIEFFKREKIRLCGTGREAEWLREYKAVQVRDGSRLLFPRIKCVKSNDWIDEQLDECEYFCSFDPASASCFAGVFIAVDKNKKIYVHNEIYETRREEMSTMRVYRKALNIMKNTRYMEIYDNAALWFAHEVFDHFGRRLIPCVKHTRKAEDEKMTSIAMINDLMQSGRLFIAERCVGLLNEMRKYSTNDRGVIVKKDDHGIDALRYFFATTNYNPTPQLRVQRHDWQRPKNRRIMTPEEFSNALMGNDV